MLIISSDTICQETVDATIYHAVVGQTNSDPSHTASMFKLDLTNPYKHRIIAVSRDLLKKFPIHSKVRIFGAGRYDGVWIVEDKMNKRWSKRIDFLVNTNVRGGKWKGVKITKIN